MPKLSFNSASQQDNPQARSHPRKVAGRIMRSRYRNDKIDKIMRQPKKVTTDGKQNKAIMALSKQVKLLQFSDYGDKQYQQQHTVLNNTVPNQCPLLSQPVFFAANSFYNDNPIYYGYVDAAPPHLAKFGNTAQTFHKQVFDLDIADQFQWNEQNNLETVSKVEYLPVYMKYKFRFMGSIKAINPLPIRYRVTLFRTKNLPITSDKKQFNLPGAGGAYWHLCDSDVSTRNYFSKSYHEVVADRWVTISPPTNDSATYKFQKTVEIPFAFKSRKPLKPNLTNQPTGQNFWTNLPQDEIIWCVISSNIEVQDANTPSIHIERVLHWRDKHGTTVGVGP